ncbi:MAG: zinc-ribbon domain-containing protein [Clostridia bacterium]|nr:zinc-ribbon domain-containing protein [Clostridia bacterium]
MFCYNCGAKISDGDKFCPYCGTKIKTTEENMNGTTRDEYDSADKSADDIDAFFGDKIPSKDRKRTSSDRIYSSSEHYSSSRSTINHKENNGLSIAGIILAFLMPVMGLILSIIAYENSKKAGEKNRVALAGIIIAICSLALSVIINIFSFEFLYFLL